MRREVRLHDVRRVEVLCYESGGRAACERVGAALAAAGEEVEAC